MQCINNLRQIGIAFLNHESAQRHFPTGGWGFQWIGDPDEGYGEDQPGGWAYNILPYVEDRSLRDMGARVTDPAARERLLMTLVATPMAFMNCPSRRPPLTAPLNSRHMFLARNLPHCTHEDHCLLAKSDYAANGGNWHAGDQPGPGSKQGASTYGWFSVHPRLGELQNGISYQRSRVRVAKIVDGTSQTAMVGEKYLNANNYLDGEDPADDQSIVTGHDRDLNRYTGTGFAVETLMPIQDRRGLQLSFHFGSAHPAGFHMTFCDGSVHLISYDVDEPIFRGYGGRNDSRPRR